MTAGPRIGLVGAGAIGGWIATRLAAGGADVRLLVRPGGLAAVRDGLTLRESSGEIRARVAAFDAAQAMGVQDVLILAVKATALRGVAAAVRPLIGPDTWVVPMQNGVPHWLLPGERLDSVDPDGSIAQAFPVDRTIGCVVHAACRRLGPARFELVQADRILLGEPAGGRSQRADALAALMAAAGLPAVAVADIGAQSWFKLWGNATLNPLSALTRSTADRVLADPALRAFLLDGMAELAAIGAAIGLPVSQSGEERLQVTARLGAFKTSMLQDVEAGRPIELDALLGAPREIARRRGIATPALDLLDAQMRQLGRALGLV